MSINLKLPVLAGMLAICTWAKARQDTGKVYHEPYRPQVHFSPKAHWTKLKHIRLLFC